MIPAHRNANKFSPDQEQLIIGLYISHNFSIYKFIPAFMTVDICLCPFHSCLNCYNSLLVLPLINKLNKIFGRVIMAIGRGDFCLRKGEGKVKRTLSCNLVK